MDLKKYRLDFPILNEEEKVIYFDNGATSLKPKQVIDKIKYYYEKCSANVHRGIYRMSMEASSLYEETHEKVANFLNSSKEEVILTQNSTDSINLIMYMLLNSNYFKEGDEIVTTIFEHHSNIVPWQFISNKLGLKLKFVDITKDYQLDMEDLKNKITQKTKLVTVVHASNTIATITPVREIAKIAHENGALVAIDGSQSAPHMKIDFKNSDFDFFAFTAHKMLGPTGVGGLIGKKELLNKFEPVRFGGDMISNVTTEKSEWNNLPEKFEAGTPNIAGAFGLGAAIDYLEDVGLENIRKQDKKLLLYLLERIQEIPSITVYNPKDPDKQGPILLFDMKGIEPIKLGALLDEMENISTRSGMHCAQPIVSRFNKKGLTRVSLYFYNTIEEIDKLIETLKIIDKDIN